MLKEIYEQPEVAATRSRTITSTSASGQASWMSDDELARVTIVGVRHRVYGRVAGKYGSSKRAPAGRGRGRLRVPLP